MPKSASSQIAVIGIDIGKNSFHMVGLDRRGAIVLRQKWSRGQVGERLATDERAGHRADHLGTGATFAKGRDFAAWLGLVPKQISTGDRTILGPISRRGNRYLRALFVQAAWVVLVRLKNWERYGLKSWIEAAKKRLHHNVLAIALANKLARIAWAVLARGGNFELKKSNELSPEPA